MNTFVLLAVLSLVGAAALFLALAAYLVAISRALEKVGGHKPAYGSPASFLSKIRLGVRAIEVQTGALGPQVTRLNEGLSAVRDGMRAIDDNLAGALEAVGAQEGR